jgi:hypothetical protein
VRGPGPAKPKKKVIKGGSQFYLSHSFIVKLQTRIKKKHQNVVPLEVPKSTHEGALEQN